jgi:hypothetical protein
MTFCYANGVTHPHFHQSTGRCRGLLTANFVAVQRTVVDCPRGIVSYLTQSKIIHTAGSRVTYKASKSPPAGVKPTNSYPNAPRQSREFQPNSQKEPAGLTLEFNDCSHTVGRQRFNETSKNHR